MIVIALGAVGALATLLNAMRTGGAGTADDPWGGQTLEWSTVTPPPPGNFAEAPALVTSEAPLLDVSSDEGEES
jgi:heme/copper-type cytochrome/quinol oxidase subunit 1